VTVRDVPSGRLVGRVGGKKFDNTSRASPDGKQVVFVRNYADDLANRGDRTAAADGSHLQRWSGRVQPVRSPSAIESLTSPPPGPYSS
jgi:hypothetical protein